MVVDVAPGRKSVSLTAITERIHTLLHAAPLTSAYHAAVSQALTAPGNILSTTRTARWAQLVCTCYVASGGAWDEAAPVAAAVELFMVALDILDDIEDGEGSQLQTDLGLGRTLNVSTGLLFLAHTSLLDVAHGAKAARLLSTAGQVACSGQHADLQTAEDQWLQLEEALMVTEQKSASLVSAICRLGALCAGADQPRQLLFARFGSNLGMVLQLTNDIAGIHPQAHNKTDIALGRPTLPLTYAKLQNSANLSQSAAQYPNLLTDGPAYLTWVVAEVYRCRALEILPQLTPDLAHQAALAELLPTLA